MYKRLLEELSYIMNIVGNANFIAIALFLIGLVVAIYFYHRTFYRLVYILKSHPIADLVDFPGEEGWLYTTRLIIYNNGRKTLTELQIKNLKLASDSNFKMILLKGNKEDLIISQEDNCVKISFKILDASEFYVFEIFHIDQLSFEGRIDESGKILHREPRGWMILNGFVYTGFIILVYVNIWDIVVNKSFDLIPLAFSIILLMFALILFRFLHSLFFVPDSIVEKYLS